METVNPVETAALLVTVAVPRVGVATRAVFEGWWAIVTPALVAVTSTVPVLVKAPAAMEQVNDVDVAETNAHAISVTPTRARMLAYSEDEVRRLEPGTVTLDATDKARLTVAVPAVRDGAVTRAVLVVKKVVVMPRVVIETVTSPAAENAFTAMLHCSAVPFADPKAQFAVALPTCAVMAV
jgi:hypothetical protein